LNKDVQTNVADLKHVRLTYLDKTISFEFAALNFIQPEKNSFAYMLENFDTKWQIAGSRNFVNYTNLDAGEYTFRVKAANNDGVWNNEGASIKIVVVPPFWRTTWFYIACITVVLITIILFFRWRTASLKRQNILLEQTVDSRTSELKKAKDHAEQLVDEKEMLIKEIHHRVKNNLEVISSLLELQSQGIHDDFAKAAVIEGQSRVQSIALIHHTLYRTDDVSSVEFKSFAGNLYKQVSGVFHKPGTEIDFAIDASETQIPIDTAVPIGLILNELLTNTFKYAVSSKKVNHIRLQLMPQATDGFGKIIYSDDGPGLPPGFNIQKSTSLGMKVIGLLTRQLGGRLHYYNDNGSIFEIPFRVRT
jgi:two-component sensor histidine kinase